MLLVGEEAARVINDQWGGGESPRKNGDTRSEKACCFSLCPAHQQMGAVSRPWAGHSSQEGSLVAPCCGGAA
jgi:hypothetical protein